MVPPLTGNSLSSNVCGGEKRDRVKREAIAFLTVGIWIVILAAGLWPFNFVPENRVRWLPGSAGLSFHGYGQAYSSGPAFLPSRRDGVVVLSIAISRKAEGVGPLIDLSSSRI